MKLRLAHTLLAASCTAVLLAGCGSSSDDDTTPEADATTTVPSSDAEPEDDTPAELPDPCLLSAADVASFIGNDLDEGAAGSDTLGHSMCTYDFSGVEGTLGYVTVWPDDPDDPIVEQWANSGEDDVVEGLGDDARFTMVDSVAVVDDGVIYTFATGSKADMTAFAQAYFTALG